MSGGRIAAAIIGGLAALLAAALLTAGAGLAWAWTTQRSDDGFFETRAIEMESDGYAVTSTEIDLGSRPGDWQSSGKLATVRVTAESGGEEVFVGIGPSDDVDAYLADVRHDEITRLSGTSLTPEYRVVDGTEIPSPPGDETFWVAGGEGGVTWDVEAGSWTVVLMNADASSGVAGDVVAAAKVDWLWAVILGVLIGGVVIAGIAAVLLIIAARRPGAVPAAPIEQTAGVYGRYPVLLEGDLDEPLSRWLWLVKWLLAIPHFIVLGFLWIAMFVLTVVAFFAILFTARYPRSIFDFNVGVMRWTWRVSFYTYSALGTDRYPPFTLSPADYPARLEVAYPERLSRGLVLVKWWLLAIPQYLIVGLFTTGIVWWTSELDNGARVSGGLIGILVLVAAVVLLFTGRYPSGLFDLVLGLNRWVVRVGSYALLMRDEYPPFHLDMGARETPVASPPVAEPETRGDGA